MPAHKPTGESGHTGTQATDLELFQQHEARLVRFTTSLQANRCRRTNRFDEQIQTTMQAFKPLFARWNMEVLFFLYMHGPRRFNGIKQVLAGISSRVLTDKLRHLSDHALIARAASDDGKKVVYALTERGLLVARHLHPLLFALQNEGSISEERAWLGTGRAPRHA